MRIIRFADPSGEIKQGEDLGNGQARALGDDLFGNLSAPGDTVAVVKLLAPLVPSNIF